MIVSMKKKYVALLLAVTLLSVAASGAFGSYYNEGHYGLTESDAYI